MGNKKRILVIEDESDLRDSLSTVLGEAGFVVIPLSESEEALANIDLINPDIVVLDLFTHSIHGIHFLERLQNLESKTKFKVIVLTNSGNAEHRLWAKELGVEVYLVKADTSISQIVETAKSIIE